MKRFKNLCAAFITVSLLLSLQAYAAETKTPAAISQEQVPNLRQGKIQSIQTINNNNENVMQIHINNDDAINDIILNVSEETYIITPDGLPVNPADLKKGDYIYAYIADFMTMSLPPITNALAIVKGEKDIPLYMEVESVTGKGSDLTLTNAAKNLAINVDKDTKVEPYRTRNIVTAEDIRPGSKLFAWLKSDNKTAEKILLTPYSYMGYIKVKGDKIEIDGVELKLDANEKPFENNGATMVPLRKIIETLGASVSYDEKKSAVIIDINGKQYELEIGKDNFMHNGSEYYVAPSVIKNDRTFIDLNWFTFADIKVVSE